MRLTQYLSLSLLTLSLAGCLNLSALHTNSIKSYQLTGGLDTKPSTLPKLNRTSAIKGSFIAPPYQGNGMAYQLNPYEVQYYVESRWQALPSVMIVTALAESLQKSELFKGVVVAPPYVGEVDQEIDVNLLELKQVFDATGQHSVERVSIQLVMSDGRTGKLQALKNFELSVPAEPNPEAGVVAANSALQQLLPSMVDAVYHSMPR